MRWIFLFFCLSLATLHAQSPLIVLSRKAPASERTAATVLQHYLQIMVGDQIPIESRARKGQTPVVFVGNQQGIEAFGLQPAPALAPDAYYLHGHGGAFLVAGGGDMGTEYGAYALLELLGCRKLTPRDSLIPRVTALHLPDYGPRLETPAFPYRELWYEPAVDPSWARWHKLKTRPQKEAEWGMFVHTFNTLCPAEKYFKEHPEYYAWNGAQRSPGQLCLSNDTVKQIVIENLRARISEKPGAIYWSVSQNDNYDYCKCSRCQESDYQLGGPSGTLIKFVNDVAAAFPDKVISTLAYQYTRRPPRNIKPADNVSICLCSIECDRGQPIEQGCNDFASDVAGWSVLTNRLMIWDYVVQFRSYVSPFPNWAVLPANLQLFQRHKVQMVFEQGSGSDRSEFSDMRAYLLAKLMWNPQANMDSILTDFGEGYYGPAQPQVWQYIHNVSASMEDKGRHLWIYDIPQNESFLRFPFNLEAEIKNLQKTPENLSPSQKQHLEAALLPLLFARLEYFKTDSTYFRPHGGLTQQELVLETLEQFVSGCQRVGFKHLNESGYTPEVYEQDYRNFLERLAHTRRSTTVSVSLTMPASAKYAHGNPRELTNKYPGELDYRYNWLGFEGTDMQATVRLSKPACSTVEVSFLQDQASWVFFPKKVRIEVSADGVQYETVKAEEITLKPDGKKAVYTVTAGFASKPVKFVRVTAENWKTCPEWHPGNGNPCWIFADEITVE